MFILQIFRIKKETLNGKNYLPLEIFLFLKVNVIKIKKISNMILYELETLMIAIGFVEGFKANNHYDQTGPFLSFIVTVKLYIKRTVNSLIIHELPF